MGYKTILTVATNPEKVQAAIADAARLCAAHDAHLDVLSLGIDRTQVGYSYVGTGAVMIEAAMERAETDARDIEKAVKAALDQQGPELRYGTDTAVAQIGSLTEIVAQRARFADLIVQPRPYGKDQGAEAEAVVEAAMFEGQSPVLVLPEGGLGDRVSPRRVVVAWNQGREAMRAVRLALPFLVEADVVNIAVIDPPSHGQERSDPGGLLCQMLVRHGVKAEVSVLAKTLPRTSDVLARHVEDQAADLLVMGAYGHSRFREAILGGTTRNMLEQAKVPVLMAH